MTVANLILNPSFETDSNADGLADNWTVSKTVSGTVTTSRVAGLFGGYAQRLEYTSSSDSNKSFTLLSDLTADGSCAADGNVTGGVWARATVTGSCGLYVITYAYTSAGTSIATHIVNVTLGRVPSSTWFKMPCVYGALPATTARSRIGLQVVGINTGDTVTIDIDGVYLSADANFDHYGKYPVIGKGAVLL